MIRWMRWLDSTTDSVYMNASKLQQIVKERRNGVLRSMGSQSVRQGLAAEQQ